jgi:ATP-dependent protease HslVU (ClpYQ) peptidase subunit
MTTIAYKWPYIVADGLLVSGYVITNQEAQKIFVAQTNVKLFLPNNTSYHTPATLIVAGSGEIARVQHIFDELKRQFVKDNGTIEPKAIHIADQENKVGDLNLLVVRVIGEAVDVYTYHSDLNPLWHDKDTHIAIGTGREFAYGAMDAGEDAPRAVQIAMNRDIYSGGKMVVYNIEEDSWESGD